MNSVHPKDKILDEAKKVAAKIAAHSGLAAATAKRAVLASYETFLQGGMDHERSLFMGLLNTHDKKEGVKAFFEKRPPKFNNS